MNKILCIQIINQIYIYNQSMLYFITDWTFNCISIVDMSSLHYFFSSSNWMCQYYSIRKDFLYLTIIMGVSKLHYNHVENFHPSLNLYPDHLLFPYSHHFILNLPLQAVFTKLELYLHCLEIFYLILPLDKLDFEIELLYPAEANT